uniref:NADH:ubiquinone oxidoreductase intermediate-associated protein 30 domain-containing protein n=1 Tax=Cacopsylla melanoneura TaxID=428564 RepID=A0A8D9B4D3_9HEMI
MKQILPKTLLGIFLLCRIQWSSSSPRRTWTYPKRKPGWSPSKNATTTPRPFNPNEKMLFDFKVARHMDDWHEDSDWLSSADMLLVGEARWEHGCFFTELETQGEKTQAFARSQYHYVDFPLDLTGFRYIHLKARAAMTEPNIVWKIFLRHNGDFYDKPSYEGIFTVPESPDYDIVEVPLASFMPMFEDTPVINAPPLNLANITMFGIQAQSPHNMKAAIHMLWIKASKVKVVRKQIVITKPTSTTKFDWNSLIDIPENKSTREKTTMKIEIEETTTKKKYLKEKKIKKSKKALKKAEKKKAKKSKKALKKAKKAKNRKRP